MTIADFHLLSATLISLRGAGLLSYEIAASIATEAASRLLYQSDEGLFHLCTPTEEGVEVEE